MFITNAQAERVQTLAIGAGKVVLRQPTNLDALPEGYIAAEVYHLDAGGHLHEMPISYGIDTDGRASS